MVDIEREEEPRGCVDRRRTSLFAIRAVEEEEESVFGGGEAGGGENETPKGSSIGDSTRGEELLSPRRLLGV